MPRLGGVFALFEDRAPRGVQQRFVVEEEEMSVEDGRAVLAGFGGDRIPGGADLGPHLLQCSIQCLPLGLGIA